MAKQNESGHDKNVANFKELIGFVKGYGEKYKPMTATNRIAFLESLLTEAKDVTLALDAEKTIFDNAVNRRKEVFEPLQKLSTRIMASYSLVATAADLDDLQGHHQKIHGIRAIKKEKPRPKSENEQSGEGDQQGDTEKSISVSQQSFDNLVRHFSKMIERLEQHPGYKPNEADLSVAGLNALLAEMEAKNDAVREATVPYKNALLARDTVLYREKTGLHDVANSTKNYVLSIYGYGTPQYRQVTRLQFKTVPK